MSSSEKRLMPRIEALVDELLSPQDEGELGLFRVGAAMVALNEAGIPTLLQQNTVILDPEQWERPHFLLALRVRNVVYGGNGRYGWETLGDALQVHLGIKGHYQEIGKSSTITVDSITRLNPQRLDQWEDELARARGIIQSMEPGLTTGKKPKPAL